MGLSTESLRQAMRGRRGGEIYRVLPRRASARGQSCGQMGPAYEEAVSAAMARIASSSRLPDCGSVEPQTDSPRPAA